MCAPALGKSIVVKYEDGIFLLLNSFRGWGELLVGWLGGEYAETVLEYGVYCTTEYITVHQSTVLILCDTVLYCSGVHCCRAMDRAISIPMYTEM